MGGDGRYAESVGGFTSSGVPSDLRNDGSVFGGRRVGAPPPVADAIEATRIYPIKEYIQRLQANIVEKVAL